jgi:hypothetical protein
VLIVDTSQELFDVVLSSFDALWIQYFVYIYTLKVQSKPSIKESCRWLLLWSATVMYCFLSSSSLMLPSTSVVHYCCCTWSLPPCVEHERRHRQWTHYSVLKYCHRSWANHVMDFYFMLFLFLKNWARSFSPGRSFYGLSRQIWNHGLFFPKLWSRWVGDLPKENFSQIWWEVQEGSRISWACAFLPMKWWSPAAQITLTRSHKSQVTHIFL